MDKEETESLAYCIRDVFCAAYLGYSMAYTIKLDNSFRMVFLVDANISPFMMDLEKDGIIIDICMVEFVIYRTTLLKKEIDMVISNTINRNRLPLIIPVDKELKEILFRSRKNWSVDKIFEYLTNKINNYGK